MKIIEHHYGHLKPAQKADVIAGRRMGSKNMVQQVTEAEKQILELVK